MAGTVGHLLTGHALLRLTDGVITHTEGDTGSTAVHFGSPSAADLNRYVNTGEPIHVAGAFTLDGLGGWFIDRIDGDPSNVIGVSLPVIRQLLGRAGLSVTDFWTC